jgi:hypothetical protein
VAQACRRGRAAIERVFIACAFVADRLGAQLQLACPSFSDAVYIKLSWCVCTEPQVSTELVPNRASSKVAVFNALGVYIQTVGGSGAWEWGCSGGQRQLAANVLYNAPLVAAAPGL